MLVMYIASVIRYLNLSSPQKVHTSQNYCELFYLSVYVCNFAIFSSLFPTFRSVIALHNLINNKLANKEAEKKEGKKEDVKEKKDTDKDTKKEVAVDAKKWMNVIPALYLSNCIVI